MSFTDQQVSDLSMTLDDARTAIDACQRILDRFPSLPDADVSSGEVEQAQGLMSRVVTDLEEVLGQ